ncbi:MAG: TatD family hydrolase, partial [Psychroserpens sp.]|nr:TatD family hydrolase [Psychroserpens sp.]
MIITDTHTHLYSDAFDEDRTEMIQRALDAKVSRFFIPAIDSGHTKAMLQLEADYPDLMFLMMGLHPTSVKDNYKEELQHVEDLLSKR